MKRELEILGSASAVTHSAVSVVNAFATGFGVTIGIEIPCRVRVTLRDASDAKGNSQGSHNEVRIKSEYSDPHDLINTSIAYALKRLGRKVEEREQLVVEVESKIPIAIGLKSSSAVSVCVVKALFEIFSEGRVNNCGDRAREILKISCLASKDSGASLTGAYDDAAASLLGGLVFSDNLQFRLIRHSRVPEDLGSIVKILVPVKKTRLTSTIDRSIYSKYRSESRDAFRYAVQGEFAQSMLMNSIVQCTALGYSIRPVTSALSEGASTSGLSGKGPAVSALCNTQKIARRIHRRWLEENSDFRVMTTNVLQPDERIRTGK